MTLPGSEHPGPTPLSQSLSLHAPHVVLGAAGSGKTTLAIDYLRRLSADGVHPDQLRLLTPTRVQASALRDDVSVGLGRSTRGAVVMSVQAFAFDLLKSERERQGGLPPRLRSGADVDQDLLDLLAEHEASGTGPLWPEHLGLEVRKTETFRTELRELIARLTELGLDARGLTEIEDAHPAWPAVGQFLADYSMVIARSRPDEFDPAELIRLATGLVNDGVLSARPLRAIIVDNFHDMSPATTDFLLALHHQGVQLLVLAEPDIAGQTFRGADPEAPARLARSLGVEPIVLESVYRHGGEIRDRVSAITSRIGTALAGSQRSAQSVDSATPGSVWSLTASSPGKEAHTVAKFLLARHREDSVAFSDMAIVVRRAGAIPAIAQSLHQVGVPTETEFRTPLSTHPASRQLIGWIQLARTPELVSSEAIAELMTGVYGGLHRRSLRRLGHVLRALDQVEGVSRSPGDALASMVRDGVLPQQLPEFWHKPLEPIFGAIQGIRALPDSTTADVLASTAWQLWGVEDQWVKQAMDPETPSAFAKESLNQVSALLRTAERFVGSHLGVSAMAFFERVLDAEVTEDVLMPSTQRQGVTIATPAQVAGMEFDTVVVAGLNEHVWPNTRIRGSLLGAPLVIRALRGQLDDDVDQRRIVIDDELRMAALAISRAASTLVVSAVHSDDEQPSALFYLLAEGSRAIDATASLALSSRELVAEYRRGSEAGDETASQALAHLASRGIPGSTPDQWWGLSEPTTLAPLFDGVNVPISPSKLSDVEESPMDWFLSRIAPEDLPPSVGMGSLLHYALEHAPAGTRDELAALVDTRFDELEFDAGWQKKAHYRKAMNYVAALAEYLSDRTSVGASVELRERRFQIDLDGATVVGYIDRVERNDDQSLAVVDLKTGAPLTDNQVVEDAQLSAYQLALRDSDLATELNTEGGVAGAWLLFVREGKGGKRYRLATQQPLDAEALEGFRQHILDSAAVMASNEFEGPREKTFGADTVSEHRWQRVGAVCGD